MRKENLRVGIIGLGHVGFNLFEVINVIMPKTTPTIPTQATPGKIDNIPKTRTVVDLGNVSC